MASEGQHGDFECLTTNSKNGIKGTYHEHKTCGYMLNVVSRIDNTCQPYLYRGKSCNENERKSCTEKEELQRKRKAPM